MKKIILPILLAIVLMGCGSTASSESINNVSTDAVESMSMGYYKEDSSKETSFEDTDKMDEKIESEQKLIKTVSLNVETKTFDEMLSFVSNKTKELNGYIESSDISGYGYDTYEGYTRYANFVVRIPSDKADSFIEDISGEGNITSKNENVEDVTLQYIDVESHIQALETEYNRLLELMETAENMEDVLAIQSRISEITYEKQNYESQLRVMNNKIEYTKISIYIDEVEKITPVEKVGFFGEISDRFTNNVKNIVEGIRNVLIILISSIPYIVLYVGIIGIIIWIIKTIDKKSKEKRLKKESKEKTN